MSAKSSATTATVHAVRIPARGYILDDRARLIDLYEACLQQDAHIRSVVETLESQILATAICLPV